jgi:hypothetical protein
VRLDHLLSKESHRVGGVARSGRSALVGRWVRVGLLSLIPCLIKRRAGWLVGGVWVWLGGTLLLLVRMVPAVWWGRAWRTVGS